jgi:hypothetical protein
MKTKSKDSGKLRIGDDWKAIRIIALSQSNPLKAIGPWRRQADGPAWPGAAKRPSLNFSIKESPCLSSSPVVSPSR